jgi:hypothetical protein
MKYIYLLLFTAICFSAHSQLKFTGGYSLSIPQQKMATNINPLHSFMAGVLYQLPGKLSRVQAGIETGWGVYASEHKKQTFIFDNGDATETGVNYNSNVVQANITTRVLLLQNKNVLPYISGKAGYTSFYSNIFVEDPDDAGACKALEQRNIIRDGAITGGYGGGLLLDFSLFSKKARKNHGYIDISVQNIRGGNIDYINTKKLIDANNPPTGTDGKPLMIKFVNATTQQIHEHEVAEVYNTPIRLMECKISVVLSL